MHSLIAHHPLMDAQLVLKHQSAPPNQLLQGDIVGMIFYVMVYVLG